MRPALAAIAAGVAMGGAIAWWQIRDKPEQAIAKQVRAEQATAAQAADAVPSLYRWRDDAGVLQITEQPPKGRKFERIPLHNDGGIEVRGGEAHR